MTPTAERLQDRLGAETRKKLATDLSAILAMDSAGPLPPAVITRIASAAGNEALTSLLPALQQELTELPAESDEEKECEALAKRFARDHFGNRLADTPEEHKEAYKRLGELRKKLKFYRPAILRDSLASTVIKLRLASDTSLLKQAVLDKSPHERWALSLLRRTEPQTWAILVSTDFAGAPAKERQTIFATIAAGHPPAAAAMIPNFNKDERRDLILEIAGFHEKHTPEKSPNDIPLILDLVRDRKQDIYRRGAAMETLAGAELSDDQIENFSKLLVAEVRNPQTTKYGPGSLAYALNALASLPQPERHLDLILSLPEIPKAAFSDGFKAVESMTRNHPEREKIIANYLRSQFVESRGMMNYHFLKALAYDLRILTPEIASFASESSKVEDGDGANYSGGNFKSPIGQRYHIAREITALWSEKNPETLARMWIAFVASHPDSFRPRDKDTAIQELAAKSIRALPAPERKESIAAILNEIPVPEHYAESRKWLESLSSDS